MLTMFKATKGNDFFVIKRYYCNDYKIDKYIFELYRQDGSLFSSVKTHNRNRIELLTKKHIDNGYKPTINKLF